MSLKNDLPLHLISTLIDMRLLNILSALILLDITLAKITMKLEHGFLHVLGYFLLFLLKDHSLVEVSAG